MDRAEPTNRPGVMHVVRPRERDEDVHVEKASQKSSKASPTISGVIGGAPSRTRKTGKSDA
jgi:hypothetical protein